MGVAQKIPNNENPKPLLVATGNRGKLREIARMLEGCSIEAVSPDQVGIDDEPDETGSTFSANALLKARHYASLSGLVTLADDSGLEIDALNGAPGVYSSRYGGKNLGAADKNALVLKQMEGVSQEQRAARFLCVMVLYSPAEAKILCETSGVMEGVIAERPAGANGFGYDPILYLKSEAKTSAQLAPARKDELSHRGQALRQMVKWMKDNRIFEKP